MAAANQKEYKSFLLTLILSAFFFSVTVAVIYFSAGPESFRSLWWWLLIFVLATVPWGWRFLNSLLPVFFFTTSIIGWVFYLLFKSAVSLFVGIVIMPIQIIKIIRLYIKTKIARSKFRKIPANPMEDTSL
jgi:hypothetical protein